MAAPAKTSDPPAKTSDSVTVAVRVRPLSARDKADGARECLRKVAGEPQLILGADRAFRFDHVFEPEEQNGAVFDTVGSDLVNGIIEGFNCTVFAYGQTGERSQNKNSKRSQQVSLPFSLAFRRTNSSCCCENLLTCHVLV